MTSLWGSEFDIPTTQEVLSKVKKKTSSPKRVVKSDEQLLKSKTVNIKDKLAIIESNVERILGSYKLNTQIITTKEALSNLIDKAIQKNCIVIDTETNNSLDPLTCKLMGACLYVPGEKNAYVPINHVDPESNELLPLQLTEQDLRERFERLSNTTIIMHNGSFDYQVIKCTCDIALHVDWDTMVGARLLNENERAGLKGQFVDKIDASIEKYSINTFFEDIEYAVVKPTVFALYAATDAYMTYKLYLYQKELFELPENRRLYNLFRNVEMPIMTVAAEMELTGVEIDQDYAQRLSAKYRQELAVLEEQINQELQKLQRVIAAWRETPEANAKPLKKDAISITSDGNYELVGEEWVEISTGRHLSLSDCKALGLRTDNYGKSKNEQLMDPPEPTSATQLAILMYDILKLPVIDKKTPRGTGEPILAKLKDKFPLGNAILDQRGMNKLLSTFVEAIPAKVSVKDNRLHAHFNQLGTDTGRFSSSDPNLQNIPSSNKAIRLMFKARDGYTIVGSDYSQQEPRLLAHYAQDEQMMSAYRDGKDLYATMASRIYDNDYWDNMEHLQDGTPNPEGKKRRSGVKNIVLGLLYGRGTASVAEQIGASMEEAQELINKFFDGFPTVRNWIENTKKEAHERGYVEDILGRRRRLPDIQLPKYEITLKNKQKSLYQGSFNPLLGAQNSFMGKEHPLIVKYKNLCSKLRGRRDYQELKVVAEKEGVELKDNTGFIAQAERQCVNARVQGGAGTITKLAMLSIYNDPIMQELGYKILICVHDEIIGECPKENAKRVGERLSELMIQAAASVCSVPMITDVYYLSRWYEDDFSDLVHGKYEKALQSGIDSLTAKNQLLAEYSMIKPERLEEMLLGTYECNKYVDI